MYSYFNRSNCKFSIIRLSNIEPDERLAMVPQGIWVLINFDLAKYGANEGSQSSATWPWPQSIEMVARVFVCSKIHIDADKSIKFFAFFLTILVSTVASSGHFLNLSAFWLSLSGFRKLGVLSYLLWNAIQWKSKEYWKNPQFKGDKRTTCDYIHPNFRSC